MVGNPSVPDVYRSQKTQGTAQFACDVQPPGMTLLHARFLRAPYPHAKIKSIDTSAAEAMDGVWGVLTGNDIRKMPFISGPRLPPQYILAVDKVRYAGENVAAVCAVDEMTAVDALEQIKVEYQPLPWATSIRDALSPDAPLIHQESGANFVPMSPIVRGDINQGFAAADAIIEGTVQFHEGNLQHSEMNPRPAVAFWNAGSLTVYEDSQWVFPTQSGLANWFGIPVSNVRVIGTLTGGAFGNKGGPVPNNMIAALFAKMTGQAVLSWNTRADQYLNTTNKYSLITYAKIGAKADGTLTAMHVIQYGDGGAYGTSSPANSLLTFRNSYVCPNGLFEGGSVYTNKPSAGAYRDVGTSQGVHACEYFIDMIAEKVKMDPAQFRLKSLVTAANPYSQDTVTSAQAGGGDHGSTVAGKTPYSSMPQPMCLNNVMGAIGWTQLWKGWGTPVSVNGSKKTGVGVAVYTMDKGGLGPYAGGMVTVTPDGNVTLYCGVPEIGSGQHTTMRIIVAEVLGLEATDVATDVNASYADTSVDPDSFIVAGSLGTHTAGLAQYRAALDLRQKLFAAASAQLGVSADQLSMKNKNVFVTGNPSQSVSFAALAAKGAITGNGYFLAARDIVSSKAYPNGVLTIQRGAAAAEVEVDVETGIVRVLNYVASHGVGRVIYAQGANNQFQGGALNAMGYAIQMEPVMDPLTGRMLNPNYHDFKQPTIKDMVTGNFQMVWEEQVEPTGPFGANGLGEPMAAPVTAAIVNAVYNATGVRVNVVPLTPDRVLVALRQGAAYDGINWQVPSPSTLTSASSGGGITD